LALKNGGGRIKMTENQRKIYVWAPVDFKLETNSIWNFPERGDWATHDSKYRGNWSPYVPRNVLLRYSNENDWVLDQFVGGGTTLVEAKLLNRNAIGVDVNDLAIARCNEKCAFERDNTGKIVIRKGDARNLDFLPSDTMDLICTHPPYANIIKYSKDIEGDISLYAFDEYLTQMIRVAEESHRVLKQNKFCVVLMGDIRRQGYVYPLGFKIMNIFESVDFKIKEIVIKQQHNCQTTDYWADKAKKQNFLLLAHEYLFVFKK
jgi:DNA modification methylase